MLPLQSFVQGAKHVNVAILALILSLSPTSRFVGTLKQHTLQGSLPGDDDLNVEHLQLLLLIFHNLSDSGRRSVLTLCTQAIAEVAAHVDSQLQAVPLNLARILLVFDYLLHQYSKAPMYLFEQVGGATTSFHPPLYLLH